MMHNIQNDAEYPKWSENDPEYLHAHFSAPMSSSRKAARPESTPAAVVKWTKPNIDDEDNADDDIDDEDNADDDGAPCNLKMTLMMKIMLMMMVPHAT